MLPRPLPTPLLAFAIRELGCVAGVMVTASHNPPQDNGYKVYLGDGSQIVPPADAEIAARIAAVGPLADVPRGDGRHACSREDIVDRYLDTVAGLAGRRRRATSTSSTRRCTASAATSVAQVARDGRLRGAARRRRSRRSPTPTSRPSSFPNPEEPGAMDLAMALAADARRRPRRRQRPRRRPVRRRGPRPARLADAARRRGRRAARRPPAARAATQGTYATLDRVLVAARPDGGRRTGSRTPRRSPASSGSAGSPGLAFGYEEALGYCVDPEHVRDKDGVSALLLLCELAADAEGRRPDPARPARRHRRASTACTPPTSSRSGSTTWPLIAAAMDRLRDTPPTSLGGLAGRAGRRPLRGLRRPAADRRAALPARRGRPGRSSARRGTEPKLKCYLEVVVPVHPEDGVEAARISAAGRLDAHRAPTSRPPPASDRRSVEPRGQPTADHEPARRAATTSRQRQRDLGPSRRRTTGRRRARQRAGPAQ